MGSEGIARPSSHIGRLATGPRAQETEANEGSHTRPRAREKRARLGSHTKLRESRSEDPKRSSKAPEAHEKRESDGPSCAEPQTA